MQYPIAGVVIEAAARHSCHRMRRLDRLVVVLDRGRGFRVQFNSSALFLQATTSSIVARGISSRTLMFALIFKRAHPVGCALLLVGLRLQQIGKPADRADDLLQHRLRDGELLTQCGGLVAQAADLPAEGGDIDILGDAGHGRLKIGLGGELREIVLGGHVSPRLGHRSGQVDLSRHLRPHLGQVGSHRRHLGPHFGQHRLDPSHPIFAHIILDRAVMDSFIAAALRAAPVCHR